MVMPKKYQAFNKLIRKNQRFILTSHIYTDGDALGSLIALYHYLKKSGKNADVLIPGSVPAKYRYLNTSEIINKLSASQARLAIKQAEVIVILDISALDRLGRLYDPVHKSPAVKVCIDHHPVAQEWIDLHIVDTQRVATGEQIYEYFKEYNIEIDLAMAEALYTAILSDSGSFRFPGTSGLTFKMAAEFVNSGIDPVEMYRNIFENGNREQLKLWGDLLSNIKSDGGLSWVTVERKLLKEHSVTLGEIDGIIDVLRKDELSSVLVVFVEKKKNEIIVGLRSKDGVNVREIALFFGGGGHFHAAGFTAYQPLNQVVEQTIEKIKEVEINKTELK
jgi:phosphoesterase RecJ-like protein